MVEIVSTGRTISTNEFLKKRREERRKFRFIVAGVLFLILVALVFVSRLDKFRINEVVVSGADVIGQDIVTDVVREVISGYYLWIIPRDNALLSPRSRVRTELSTRFRRFSSIDVSLEGFQSLSVTVREREPFALYCAGDEPCWFLDKDGFIFDSAPSFSEGVYFIYTQSLSLENPLGQYFLPKEEFVNVGAFISGLKPLGFEPLSLMIDQDDLTLSLKSGAKVLWRKGNDLPRTLSNLSALLASESIKTDQDFIFKLSTLDLSIEDKIRWTFKE